MLSPRLIAALLVAIAILAGIANWPRQLSSIKPGFEQAGFPQVFAIWRDERLVSFNVVALLIDVAIPLLAVTVLLAVSIRRK